MGAKTKIIIDTDPGIDDAIALFMAMADPDLEIVGITAVNGNVTVDKAEFNARRVCDFAWHTDIPVYKGCDRPLKRPTFNAEWVHGSDGLAGLDFGTPNGGMNLSTPPSEQILGKVSSDIFREMAEMERENSTLMLQLKREQLRSEIDALKTSNRQMLFDEIERREKMTQARLEWELAQDLKRQEALERKQRAEIRQKQIEAALKREEDRRIQKMKEEEAAQAEKEKQEKEEQKKQRAELKKKYDAASLVRLNSLKPVLMAATKPAKIKRSTTSRIPKALTSTGEDLLTKKRAGEALTVTVSADEAKEAGGVPQESASKLYAVSEIRGTAGSLIAKLISKKDKTTFFAKKSTILPTGHTVIDIDKDYVLVQIGNNKEMIGFPSAGLLSDAPVNNSAPAAERGRSEEEENAAPEPEPRPKRRKSSPISASAGVRASFSGASLAR